MKKRWWSFVQRHKKKVLAVLITLIIFLLFFSTQIILFFNFMIGNDTAVKLKVSPEYLQLVHGQQEPLTVEASVTTNPFCKADCSSIFEDISQNKIIDNATFTLRPSDPFQHQYKISAPLIGEGTKVYRFSMECRSVQTVLCHTSEEPSTRSVLITAEYGLTSEEKELRTTLQKQLQNISRQVDSLQEKNAVYEKIATQLNFTFESLSDFSNQVQKIKTHFQNIDLLWEQQDFNALVQQISEINILLSSQEQQNKIIMINVAALVQRYNAMIENTQESKLLLDSFSTYDAANSTTREMMNTTAAEFNDLVFLLSQSLSFEHQENVASLFLDKVSALSATASAQQREDVLKRELETDMDYDLLCDGTGICYPHHLLSERSNQTHFNLNKTCEDSNLLRTRILDSNSSFREKYAAEDYPSDTTFAGSIFAQLFNQQQEKINEYRENIPENKTNTLLLKELLRGQPLRSAEEYPDYNLTPALLAELAAQLPASCTALPVALLAISPLNLTPIEIPAITPAEINFTLTEPKSQCYLFGKYQPCCATKECQNDPSTYPVVFIHGHALSKDTSFEYSLEGFNQLQQKLEEDGYVSAGAITLYTSRDVPEGIWRKLPFPVSIRASYYLDLFQQPENYVVVQAKSENIDTYALRLKEVIDTIKYKTGKPKVNIVAFSMGSLVSRRYIQIFGEDDVNRLILIGAPNKGVVGNVADYCSVTGEQRECMDMDAQSLFMNKLNRGSLPKIPIYNIIGTGCDMNGKQGDGAVLQDHAYLEGTQNFVIKGKCESVSEPLHLQLLNINKYPKVYKVVKEALQK